MRPSSSSQQLRAPFVILSGNYIGEAKALRKMMPVARRVRRES